MTIIDIEIIMRTIDVGRYYTGELASVFFLVCSIHNVNHPLGVGIPFVAVVWRSIMDLQYFVENNFCKLKPSIRIG